MGPVTHSDLEHLGSGKGRLGDLPFTSSSSTPATCDSQSDDHHALEGLNTLVVLPVPFGTFRLCQTRIVKVDCALTEFRTAGLFRSTAVSTGLALKCEWSVTFIYTHAQSKTGPVQYFLSTIFLSAGAAGFDDGFSDALLCCFSPSRGCAGRGLSLDCFLLSFSRSMFTTHKCDQRTQH